MALSKNAIPIPSIRYDVFIFFDEEDTHVADMIKAEFQRAKISYCDLEEHSHGGCMIFQSIELLQRCSQKTLVVVPASITPKTEGIIQTIVYSGITPVLAFVAEDCNTPLYCMSGKPIIYQDTRGWAKDLINEVRTKIPDYCVEFRANLSIDLQRRGLSFSSFCCDIFGLNIFFCDKLLHVDLLKLKDHYNEHREYTIPEVCGQCNLLRSVDTRVRLDLPSAKHLTEEAKSIYSSYLPLLISQIIDFEALSTGKEFRSFAFSLKGIVKSDQREYFQDLYKECNKEVTKMWQESFQQPLYPEHADEQRRLQTFEGKWDESVNPTAQNMAAAGYICIGQNVARCFSCGNGLLKYRKNMDPAKFHKKFTQCNFISKIDTEVHILSDINIEFSDSLDLEFENFNFAIPENTRDEDTLRKEMEKAGFYHLGFNLLICFECGVCIRYKNGRTSPCDLHAIVSPTCSHLTRYHEYPNFINSVSAQREDTPMRATFFVTDSHSPLSADQRNNKIEYMFSMPLKYNPTHKPNG